MDIIVSCMMPLVLPTAGIYTEIGRALNVDALGVVRYYSVKASTGGTLGSYDLEITPYLSGVAQPVIIVVGLSLDVINVDVVIGGINTLKIEMKHNYIVREIPFPVFNDATFTPIVSISDACAPAIDAVGVTSTRIEILGKLELAAPHTVQVKMFHGATLVSTSSLPVYEMGSAMLIRVNASNTILVTPSSALGQNAGTYGGIVTIERSVYAPLNGAGQNVPLFIGSVRYNVNLTTLTETSMKCTISLGLIEKASIDVTPLAVFDWLTMVDGTPVLVKIKYN